jgi:hypothetical protein
MIAEKTTDKIEFNYVWQCTRDAAREGESIPIREGDYLFICVDGNGAASFRYRKCDWRTNPDPCKVSTANAEYWAGATGRFDAKTGEVSGATACGTRKFTMKIERKKDSQGFNIRCEHVRNPPEGNWDGDDDWGGQQTG